MNIATYEGGKKKILKGTFEYLVECGLENLRIRALCKYLGLTQNALYYWFGNKEDLISNAAIYGLRNVSDNIFSGIMENINNIDRFFEYSLEKIEQNKKELRSIYQLAASPVFGDKLRKGGRFTPVYDKYARVISEYIECDFSKIQSIVYLFAASVLDYAIWEDKAEIKVQFEFIRSYIKEQKE